MSRLPKRPAFAPVVPLVAVVLGALATGCASVGPVREDCARVAVDSAPVWTAAASWTGRGDELLLVDPERRGLLAYDLEGRLVDRVEAPELAALDYSLPIRIEPAGRTAVIGDRSGVLEMRRRGLEPVLGEVPGVESVLLGDWTLSDDGLVGYADLTDSEGGWKQGFVRLGRRGVERLLDLPIERGGEYESYHHYHQRPYVARADDEVYVLRYTSPATVSRVVGGGLAEIWRADDDETTKIVALLGWDDALYLVVGREFERPVDADQPTAPVPRSTGGGEMLLEAMAPMRTDLRWELARLDPRHGRITWRRPLPTEHRPVLAPGPRAWALIDSRSTPHLDPDDGESTWLTLVPTDRFGADAPARFCEPLAGVKGPAAPSRATPAAR